MSLGGDTQSSLIKDAIDYATDNGVLVVAAAGNDRKDGIGSIDYPGAYVNVVAVAAFDSTDNMADFSSLGATAGDWSIEEKEIEFAAPGVSVESTWKNGCYNTISGTSMATPHIAGIAAKDWQGTAAKTRVYLQDLAEYYTKNVKDYGQTGDDIEAGFGLPIAP
jgi:subtilisin